jgi:hypothetical protein
MTAHRPSRDARFWDGLYVGFGAISKPVECQRYEKDENPFKQTWIYAH